MDSLLLGPGKSRGKWCISRKRPLQEGNLINTPGAHCPSWPLCGARSQDQPCQQPPEAKEDDEHTPRGGAKAIARETAVCSRGSGRHVLRGGTPTRETLPAALLSRRLPGLRDNFFTAQTTVSTVQSPPLPQPPCSCGLEGRTERGAGLHTAARSQLSCARVQNSSCSEHVMLSRCLFSVCEVGRCEFN